MENKDKILILRKLIDYIQTTDANFGQSIGVSKSEISKYINGKQIVTDKLIRKIIANYPTTQIYAKVLAEDIEAGFDVLDEK